MNTSLSALHERYSTQALWTEELRQNLIKRIDLPPLPDVLEVGSGTGCITSWASRILNKRVWGVDIDFPTVQYACKNDESGGYAQADGGFLPFPDDTFDLVFSHFLLLWTPDPIQILSEMKRCVRQNGWIIAFAEPDYGGRIDFPVGLSCIGDYQADSLKQSGAAPHRGRELRGLFTHIGLHGVTAGLLGGEWGTSATEDLDSEWATLRVDLNGLLSPAEIDHLENLDRKAWKDQQRILFNPTFYAIGKKST